MKLITGLGNPGKKYQKSRHNVGFLVLDRLRERFLFQKNYNVTDWEEEKTFMSEMAFLKQGSRVIAILQKPLTYMNNSGQAVSKVIKKYDIEKLEENFILIHDDLDIPFGKYKIQKSKSPKGHNGVADVESLLQTTKFQRVRVGIESRIEKNIPGEDFVLMNFTKDEQIVLDEVIDDVVNTILPEILL
ncbi:MAG TPA: aminoacyl-tRNA hydrolase [Candidatus Dojkabacteria bacterium]|jgi:PTH1 family peptidyl-tRNA hydrolase|nr:aminoacyl-tRNA hydrolase [Candidatus Dojkabacteria bacterium]